MYYKMLILGFIAGCYGGPSKFGDQNGTGGSRLFVAPALSDVDGVKTVSYNPDRVNVITGSVTSAVKDSTITFSPNSLASGTQVTVEEGISMTSAMPQSTLGFSAESSSQTVSITTSQSNTPSTNPFTISIGLGSAGLTEFALDETKMGVVGLIYGGDGKIQVFVTDQIKVSNKSIAWTTKYFGSYQAMKIPAAQTGTRIFPANILKISTAADKKKAPTPTPAPATQFSALSLVDQNPRQNSTGVDPYAQAFLKFNNPIDSSTVGANIKLYQQNFTAQTFSPPTQVSQDKLGITIFPPDGMFPLNAWQNFRLLPDLKDTYGQNFATPSTITFKTRDGIWNQLSGSPALTPSYANANSFNDARIIKGLMPGQLLAYWSDNVGSMYYGSTAQINRGVLGTPSRINPTYPSMSGANPIQAKFFSNQVSTTGVIFGVYSGGFNKIFSNRSNSGSWSNLESLIVSSSYPIAFDVVTNSLNQSFLIYSKYNLGSTKTDIIICLLVDMLCSSPSLFSNSIPSNNIVKLSGSVYFDGINNTFSVGLSDSTNCYGFSGLSTANNPYGASNFLSSVCRSVQAFSNSGASISDRGILMYEETSGIINVAYRNAGAWSTSPLFTNIIAGQIKAKNTPDGRILLSALSTTGNVYFAVTRNGANFSPAATSIFNPSAGSIYAPALSIDSNDQGDVLFAYSMVTNLPTPNNLGAAILDKDGITIRDQFNVNSNAINLYSGLLNASIDNLGNGLLAFVDGMNTTQNTPMKIQSYRFDPLGSPRWNSSTNSLFSTNYISYTSFGKIDLVKDPFRGVLTVLYGYCFSTAVACGPGTVSSAPLGVSQFN